MADIVQQARIDLAAALRLAARFDLSEGVCNRFGALKQVLEREDPGFLD